MTGLDIGPDILDRFSEAAVYLAIVVLIVGFIWVILRRH